MCVNEKELIKLCKSRDLEAFSQLVEKYQAAVFNLSYNLLNNRQDAEDAVQEVFIKVYNSIDKFNETASLYTWIYKITKNVCIDAARTRKDVLHFSGMQDKDNEQTELDIKDTAPGPEEVSLQSEKNEKIRLAISRLKADYRIMIVLRDVEGLSYDDIAKIQNLSVGTVKSRINRAREILKNIIKKEFMELL